MSRVNSFFLVLFALSSVCFGATLMHLAVSYSAPGNAPRAIKNLSDCEELFGPEVHKGQKAAELYKKAFQLSFFGTAAQARLASECSCLLKNGGTRWAYETSDLIKGIANIEP